MNITTKTRYGSRAMIELALVWPDRIISVKEIARNQRISTKFLEQILAALKAADLVRSVRGTGGGYALTRAPEEIRMLDVFKVLEGSPALVDCCDHPEVCDYRPVCPIRDMWVEASNAVATVLGKTTLKELADRAKRGPAEAIYEV
ncbi:MAG TPA: Rrf2 family transcriptional regulator [Sumerlaeia bacterium]|nr:Rrf2 family transcriptional regulator [Sumerlaeia bacterium]